MKTILTSLKIGALATLTVVCVLAAIHTTPVYWLTAATFGTWTLKAIAKSAWADLDLDAE